jgi:hypothetical protein
LGPLPSDLLFSSGAFAIFPLFILLTVVVLVLAALAMRLRPRKVRMTDAYTGGEPFTFQTAGAYFYGVGQGRKVALAFNLLASILLVTLFILPLLQEVGVWTP